MADYTSAYHAIILVNTITDNIISIVSSEEEIYLSSGNFEDGGFVDAFGSPPHLSMVYVGQVEGGWIGFDLSGYHLFSNVDPRTLQLPAHFSTEPFAVCFLAGTSIATPDGATAVEDLKIGDLVTTSDGRTMPVRWVGRQTIATVFANALRTLPVRIAAGALGEGLPARDLFVSPDHALLVDGVLVQAGALVNGATITRVTEMPERFTYYHVELEDHSLVLAEGTPAETFVDNVTRQRFDNYAEYEALYGEAVPTIAEIELPRVKSARQLPASLRQRLQERAAALLGTSTATAA